MNGQEKCPRAINLEFLIAAYEAQSAISGNMETIESEERVFEC